jgi:hypothetical protein
MASDSLFLTLALLVVLVSSATAAEEKKHTAVSIFKSTEGVTIGPNLIAIGAITLGGIICAAGYRLFRATIFLCGFLIGGVATASLIEYLFKNKAWMVTASWIGFLAGGIIVGVFAMTLYSVSLFVAGAAAGVFLAFTLQTTVAYKLNEKNPNTVLVVLALILGLVGGIVALKLEKPVLVLATSFAGAVMLAWGIGHFAGKFPNATDLKHYATMDLDGDTIITIPSSWWGYLGLIVVATLGGAYVQFRKTGRNRNGHDELKTSQNATHRV